MGAIFYQICCPTFNLQTEQNSLQQQLVQVQKKKIGFEDFVIEGKLGEGGFGRVFLAQLKRNIDQGIVQKYAIKMVSKRKIRQKHLVQNAFDEKYIAMYNHDFIVNLIMCFQDQYFIFMVLQYASGGDTYSLINKKSPKFESYQKLGQKGVRFIAACVILGLQFLHANGYMYRDLKPQNVLLFEDGYVKLSDFGLAKKNTQDQVSKTFIGTAFYYSPQMVLGKGYNRMVDLWALGVYLYQMSNYQPPFSLQQIKSSPQNFENICLKAENQRVWVNPEISSQLKDLINRLLICDQNHRLGQNGWSEIKSHPFFKGFKWKQLEQLKMQSPLKQIAKAHPKKIKQFKQQLSNINRQKSKLEGWSYYGKYAQQNNTTKRT